MKAIRNDRKVVQAKRKMWPLAEALTAAGLASVLLGGCAMTDSNRAADVQMRAMPLVVRTAQSPEAHYALGKYYFYQGRFEQAREAFADAVRLEPGHVDALNGLGVVHDRLGQYDEARKAYDAALHKDPAAAHVWANLGYSLILAGKSSEAAAPLQRAVSLDPANALAQQHLASVQMLAGSVAAAAQAETSKTPAGPVASVVTAKGIDAAAAAMPAGNPARAEPQRQAQTPVPPANTQARPESSPAQSVIASVVNQSSHKGATVVQKVVSMPALPSVRVEQKLSSAPLVAEVKAPAAKAAPAARTAAGGNPESLRGLRIEVSNGNGVTGMARAVGTEMRQAGGLNIARITNARPFNKPQTLILCSPEMKAAAMELAQSMPVRPRIVLRDVAHRQVDVRVVLGADTALALKEGAKGPYRVAGLDR